MKKSIDNIQNLFTIEFTLVDGIININFIIVQNL